MNQYKLDQQLIEVLLRDDDVPLGLILIDVEGDIVTFNSVAKDHFGLRKKGLGKDKSFQQALGGFPELCLSIKNCLSGRQEQFGFGTLKLLDRYLSLKGSTTDIGVVIISIDNTRSRVREMDMLSALLDGQEMERGRIAKEIHDGVGPLISTIKLHMEALKMELSFASDEVQQRVGAIEELVHQIAEDIREVSHALTPTVLTNLGLLSALEQLCDRADKASSAKVLFFSTGINDSVDLQLALSLYRIAQELLNNALKYSRANFINLQLIQHADSIILTVEDDGIGFERGDLKQQMKKGIGISNVITRTRSLSGTYSIEAQEGKGVFISVEIPLIQEAQG